MLDRSIPYPIRALFDADRTGYRPRSGIMRALAVAIVLIVFLALGEKEDAGVAGLGALIGGIADLGGPKREAFPYILICAGVSAIGAFLGAVTADNDAIAIATAAVFAFACGTLARYGRRGAVAGLTSALALIVAQAHWLDPGSAVEHAGLVLIGGAVQALVLLVPVRFETRFLLVPVAVRKPQRRPVPKLVLGSSLLRHSLRLGLAIGVGVATYRLLPFGEHGYWVATTALFILRPGFDTILASALARYLGTALAVVAASLIAALLEPGEAALVALVAGSSLLCFALFQYNFALFTIGVSAVLIFLAALEGLPPASSARDFLIDSTFGAAVALAAYAVVPRIKTPEIEAGAEPAQATT